MTMTLTVEHRNYFADSTASVIRADSEGVIVGIAAPYNVVVSLGGGSKEGILPNAFDDVLMEEGRDFLGLVDHDKGKVIARSRNSSLSLWSTDDGLAYRMQMPDTQLGRDTYAMAKEGLLGGVSIGFARDGSNWKKDGDVQYLERANLIEVSLITHFPAYPTTAEARNADPVPNIVAEYLAARG